MQKITLIKYRNLTPGTLQVKAIFANLPFLNELGNIFTFWRDWSGICTNDFVTIYEDGGI